VTPEVTARRAQAPGGGYQWYLGTSGNTSNRSPEARRAPIRRPSLLQNASYWVQGRQRLRASGFHHRHHHGHGGRDPPYGDDLFGLSKSRATGGRSGGTVFLGWRGGGDAAGASAGVCRRIPPISGATRRRVRTGSFTSALTGLTQRRLIMSGLMRPTPSDFRTGARLFRHGGRLDLPTGTTLSVTPSRRRARAPAGPSRRPAAPR